MTENTVKYSENGFWIKKEADKYIIGLSEKGQWRVWTALYVAAALAQAIMGMPAYGSGRITMMEAAAVLSDGVAATRSDIDTVLVHGYGFPAKRGGPWFWAELGDLSTATDRMRRWAEETGDPRWLPHSHLLEQAGATA